MTQWARGREVPGPEGERRGAARAEGVGLLGEANAGEELARGLPRVEEEEAASRPHRERKVGGGRSWGLGKAQDRMEGWGPCEGGSTR